MATLHIRIDGAPGMEATREATVRNTTSEAVWLTVGEMLSECTLSEMLDGITISFELKGSKHRVGAAFLPREGGAD